MSSDPIALLGNLILIEDRDRKKIAININRVMEVEDGDDRDGYHKITYTQPGSNSVAFGKIHYRYYRLLELRYAYRE